RKRKETGLFPLVVEPRWAAHERPFVIAYHPDRQHEWFPLSSDDEAAIVDDANLYFSGMWGDVTDFTQLTIQGKDSIKAISFEADVASILDELPEKKKGLWDDLKVDPVRGQKKKEPAGMK